MINLILQDPVSQEDTLEEEDVKERQWVNSSDDHLFTDILVGQLLMEQNTLIGTREIK